MPEMALMESGAMRRSGRINAVWAALVALVIVVPAALAGVNTWTTAGPDSVLVQTLATDPTGASTLYAGGFGTLFDQRSGRWEKIAEGSVYPYVFAVAVDPRDPRTIYVGVSDAGGFRPPTGGLYKSSDGGRTWVFLDVFQGYPVSSIVIDPSETETIYVVASLCSCLPRGCFAGTSCSGRVFKSVDSGLTWARKGVLEGASSLVIDPKTPSTIYSRATGGVFKTQDGGSNWSAINEGLSPCGGAESSLAISATDPKTLFVTVSSLCPIGLYKTTDGGLTWHATGLRHSEFGVATGVVIDPTNADVAYLAAFSSVSRPGGLFRTTDGGQTWSRLDAGLPGSDIDLLAVDQDGGGIHVSIYKRGVYDYQFVASPRTRNRPPFRSRPPITVPNH